MNHIAYPVALNPSAPGSYTHVEGHILENEGSIASSPEAFKKDAGDLLEMGYKSAVLVAEDEAGDRCVVDAV